MAPFSSQSVSSTYADPSEETAIRLGCTTIHENGRDWLFSEERREEKRSSIPLKRVKPCKQGEELKHLKQKMSIVNEIYTYRYNVRKLTSDKNREISEYLRDDQHFFALKVLNKYKDISHSDKQREAIQEVLRSLNQFAFKALEIFPSSDPGGPSELNPLLENLKAAVRDLKKEMEETIIDVDLSNRRPDYAYS